MIQLSKINVLDTHIAQLIAAGEVVERPSSAIKELVENSIDAGANKITVEIKNGGNTFMRVTDNGSGISKEDVPKAFLPHATSKIKSEDELSSILTLGFRGEALASIAAVSRVALTTKIKDELLGTVYKIEGSKEVYIDEAGCADGTTIVIEDLFFNTPARLKFLKKDVSEANSVALVIDRLALSHPEIAFNLIRDGKECLVTNGDNNLKNTIYCVYGKDFAKDLIEVDYELDGIKVSGFISKPINSRPNRSMQNFFVNKRYVRISLAYTALEQAYKGSILSGKFPSCVLNIEIKASSVDVNVHPAKTEVKFVNEKPIFSAIYYGVKSALEKDKSQVNFEISNFLDDKETKPKENKKEIILNKKDKEEVNLDTNKATENIKPTPIKFTESPEIFTPKASVYSNNYKPELKVESAPKTFNFNKCISNPHLVKEDSGDFIRKSFFENEDINIKKPAVEEKNCDKFKPLEEGIKDKVTIYEKQEEAVITNTLLAELNSEAEKTVFIGEIFKTYIVAQRNNEFILIDKHAAHEKLIYNNLKKDGLNGFSQALLEPIQVVLSKNEYGAALENISEFNKFGFDIDDFGQGMIVIRSSPMMLKGSEIKEAFIEIAAYISENKSDLKTNHMDWIYKSIACKAAIKAGDSNTKSELVKLLSDLDKSTDAKYCPHGRPISVIMTKKEIEKQFKRT